MMRNETVRFELVNKDRGSDIEIRGHRFVDGVCEFSGNASEIKYVSRVLRLYGVRIAGAEAASPALPAAPSGSPAPDTTQPPQPNEPPGDLAAALRKLDPADDSHWTQGGKPAIAAVEQLLGTGNLKRDDIERAIPGFLRPKPDTTQPPQN